MATLKFKVNSIETFREAMTAGADFWDEHKYIQVTFSDKRSLNANALQHEWYKIIALHYGCDTDDIKNHCKYKYGMPILLRRDTELRDWLKERDWPSEEAKIAMVSRIKVTSTFSTDEAREYMDAIKNHYASEGFVLPSKKDLT